MNTSLQAPRTFCSWSLYSALPRPETIYISPKSLEHLAFRVLIHFSILTLTCNSFSEYKDQYIFYARLWFHSLRLCVKDHTFPIKPQSRYEFQSTIQFFAMNIPVTECLEEHMDFCGYYLAFYLMKMTGLKQHSVVIPKFSFHLIDANQRFVCSYGISARLVRHQKHLN